jgi:hypothetical protein
MLPFIIPLLTGTSGLVIGALSRQPEINRLKEQVRVLQREVTALRRIMQEQQRQIEELKIRYNSLKAWNFAERRRTRGMTRGSLILHYGLRDYVEFAIVQARGKILEGADLRFFNTFNAMVSDCSLSLEDKALVKEYVIAHHRYQVDNLIPISDQDQNALVSMLEAA